MLKHSKFILKAALLVATCCTTYSYAYAQEIRPSEPRVWTDISGEDCETIKSALDFAMIDAGHTMIDAGVDKPIIINVSST